jgi:FKBP-type peptidyl-prolyl cis-trans isomerase
MTDLIPNKVHAKSTMKKWGEVELLRRRNALPKAIQQASRKEMFLVANVGKQELDRVKLVLDELEAEKKAKEEAAAAAEAKKAAAAAKAATAKKSAGKKRKADNLPKEIIYRNGWAIEITGGTSAKDRPTFETWYVGRKKSK